MELTRGDLQQRKYNYIWERDQGDSPYSGKLDRIKVDKDEGYEVLHFIQSIVDSHNISSKATVHKIEDAMHSPELKSIDSRERLTWKVELSLGLG